MIELQQPVLPQFRSRVALSFQTLAIFLLIVFALRSSNLVRDFLGKQESFIGIGSLIVLLCGAGIGMLYIRPFLGIPRADGMLPEQIYRLANVVDGTSNIVIITDCNRRITWVNKGFVEKTGYTLKEVLGKSPGSVLQFGDTDPATVKSIRESLDSFKPCACEIQNRTKSGETYWIEMLIEPVVDRAGRVSGFFAIETDITKRKNSESVLRESQQLLSAAIGSIPAHIAILDSSGTIIDVNAMWKGFAAENQFQGYNFGVGLNYLQIVENVSGSDSEGAKDAAEGIRSVISGKSDIYEQEYPCHFEQTQRWFRMTVTRFKISQNPYVVVAHENITTRRLAEHRLANEQSKFRCIYDGTSDAIMLLDSNGFFDCNPRTLQLFGVKDRDHFFTLHPDDISPKFQPDGSLSREKADWHISIAMQNGENRFEWMHCRIDGVEFPAEVLLSALDLDGRRVLQATVRDITVRKQNEKQLKELNDRLQIDLEARRTAEASLRKTTAYLDVYRQIVDHHAIVAETDVSGKIVRVNDAFCRISEYSREELIGQNHRILNSGLHPKEVWKGMYKTVANGGIWRGEICNQSKTGKLYWVDTTIAPLYDESEKLRGYFALRADITNLKNAQKQAESSSLAKSEFLANMSHEIRTPMTAILGFADLLADEIDPEKLPMQSEYIETIKRNGEHLLTIINDILDISKIEAEKMVIEKIETDPLKIVDDVVSSMQVYAKAKGLSLHAELTSAVPRKILSDPTRVRQILENLVGNAIKFTEKGGVEIRVGLDLDNPQLIQFAVIDTGIGIKHEEFGRLFGSFEQADASTTRRYGGSGLGLCISKKLSEMLGGSLTFSSELGKGSAFTAKIKTYAPEDTEMVEVVENFLPVPAFLSPSPSSNRLRLKGVRVLLVEDGVDNQRLISYHLDKAGAIVQIVPNGKIAVQSMTCDGTLDGPLIDPSPFDLILSDIQMPEMDGYTSTKMLRAKGCNIPVIALTAHAMRSDAKKCIAAGCNFHLSKPIDQHLLISTCETWSNMQNENSKGEANMFVSEYANDPEMTDLLNEYVASFSGTVTTIRKKLEDRSFVELGRIAHQLKGSGGGYGFPGISDAASKLEANVKAKTEITEVTLENIQKSVEELVTILENVRSASVTAQSLQSNANR